MNNMKKNIALCLVLIFIFSFLPLQAQAKEYDYRINREIIIDGTDLGQIKTLDYSYRNDSYISLKGLAVALSGTAKAYSVSVSSSEINITTGENMSGEIPHFSDEEVNTAVGPNFVKKTININGNERVYYSIAAKDASGEQDCYMSLVDVSMLLDLSMSLRDGTISIDTNQGFLVTGEQLEESGYLMGVNGLVIGDGTTGDVYYAYNENQDFAIASTTKLMTYLIYMEAVKNGEVGLNDVVTVSKEAQLISESDDGTTPMKEGMNIPVNDLLIGLLLPSSNESAYTLAQHVAGSEAGFVERMNSMAEELGLSSAIFYNSHGLPIFDDVMLPAKKQNHMSAQDMFTLSSYIMQEYPEITQITSTKKAVIKSLNQEVKNTNALLYNIPEARGLKTGTTNKSGACLVTCVPMEKDGQVHNLIVVLFGAESNVERNRLSEISARYAMSVLSSSGSSQAADKLRVMPKDPNKVVDRLVKAAF